jgi:hypothetical protein
MTENRREAFRVAGHRPGRLEFSGRALDCVVLDVSASGARVRFDAPTLVPDRVVLRTTLADQEIAVAGRLQRAEPGPIFAVAFESSGNSALYGLIAEAQRIELLQRSKRRPIDVFAEHAPGTGA